MYEKLDLSSKQDKKLLKEMEAEINATNTVDVAGEHANHYDGVFENMKLIELDELNLIHQAK